MCAKSLIVIIIIVFFSSSRFSYCSSALYHEGLQSLGFRVETFGSKVIMASATSSYKVTSSTPAFVSIIGSSLLAWSLDSCYVHPVVQVFHSLP